ADRRTYPAVTYRAALVSRGAGSSPLRLNRSELGVRGESNYREAASGYQPRQASKREPRRAGGGGVHNSRGICREDNRKSIERSRFWLGDRRRPRRRASKMMNGL